MAKFYTLLLVSAMVCFSLVQIHCSKGNQDDSNALLLLLSQNPGNETAVGILEIEVRDVSSYSGKCLDTFAGMTAGAYFEVHYPPAIRNLPDKKSVTLPKPCNLFGFSGGVSNRLDGTSFSFRSYTCGPATGLCANSAIKEVGF